jgi:hypothetical protein
MPTRLHRTQIYLTPEQAAALDRIAARRGCSRAELIREAADTLISSQGIAPESPIWDIVGMGESDVDDGSERHDAHLLEIAQRSER